MHTLLTQDLTRKEVTVEVATELELVYVLNLLDLATRPDRWSRRRSFSEGKQISEMDYITLKLIKRLPTT